MQKQSIPHQSQVRRRLPNNSQKQRGVIQNDKCSQEECKKVGLEKHNVKTQVLTNGIKEHCDDRRLILKHFNDKVKVDKKTKEYRKQSKLEKQRNKCKKKPNKREQAHTAPVKTKKKISKKKP